MKRGHWFKIKNIRECEVDIEELPAFMSITGSNELVTCGDTRITKRNENKQKPSHVRKYSFQDRVNYGIKEWTTCQSMIEPLKMSKMQSKPRTNLRVHFYGPLSTGDYLFSITDEN